MNKSELIEKVAEKGGLAKGDAEKAINALIETVQGAVAADDKVTLPGFGAWSRTQRAAPWVATRAPVSPYRSRPRRPSSSRLVPSSKKR